MLFFPKKRPARKDPYADPIGRESREKGWCVDCHSSIKDEFFMVHDPVWAKARMENYGGFLCVGCLEKRIGRRLRRGDFTDCPMNKPDFTYLDGRPVPKSRRLRNRLGI
ncbi:hypothetical protein SAMN06297387_11211 [Streptomyces zhaozhouensis]|uniref:Uncharacterized protein n=1 Tax=Streptomyces zhaozhouensis TaxID=1300267 RepID=A0A286DYB3_9ACTN|nr:hypothetical protein [Streptomyces zhaozhouensis]SOD63658.1 hypothetical protein SAMN06297387_11211 [Streptomyces zhaozhouensis]